MPVYAGYCELLWFSIIKRNFPIHHQRTKALGAIFWSLVIRHLMRQWTEHCTCTPSRTKRYGQINYVLPVSDHHRNRGIFSFKEEGVFVFSEEIVTWSLCVSLRTDGALSVFGVYKGEGNFGLSSVWRIVASGSCQRSWLLWWRWSLKQCIL
jgi:hypothetical protein